MMQIDTAMNKIGRVMIKIDAAMIKIDIAMFKQGQAKKKSPPIIIGRPLFVRIVELFNRWIGCWIFGCTWALLKVFF